jgi:uncharacterized protein (DUF4415 family)
MKKDFEMKTEYDLEHMKKADPARHREILARGERAALVVSADGASSLKPLTRDVRVVTVKLDSDVTEAFPTSESINEALRLLLRAAESRERKAG